MTKNGWIIKANKIIFEANTPAGKTFDVILLWAILLSIFSVLLESVQSIRDQWGYWLKLLEWTFTILFTIEYGLRILTSQNRVRYVRSFYGIVDLLAIIPTYLSLVLTGPQFLIVIRGLRLLRIFRILKLSRYIGEADVLRRAILASSAKIVVFIGTVITLVIIIGTLMYLIEGPQHGFTSIPRSMYWTIVTLTTVGYGDIAPETVYGQFLAAIVMILGYGIIAVPTGIVTVELSRAGYRSKRKKQCPNCLHEEADENALFCRFCGEKLKVVNIPVKEDQP